MAWHCRQLLPTCDFLYYGDTARAPYGNKSAITVAGFARQNLRRLANLGACAALIACGTVCAVTGPQLAASSPIPLIEIIRPSALATLDQGGSKSIGVLATKTTVASGAYKRAFAKLDPLIDIESVACPLLAAHIEEGLIDHPATRALLAETLAKPQLADVDVILLGCTHFSFVRRMIEALKPGVRVIDPALACAKALEESLRDLNILASGRGSWRLIFSDSQERWENRAEALFARLERDQRDLSANLTLNVPRGTP